MEANPGLVRKILEQGHEIGVHSYTHPNMAAISEERARLEFNASLRFIEALTNRSTILFRPPYSADSRPHDPAEGIPVKLAQDLGYITVTEDIDPEDWAKPVLIPFQRTWEDAVAVSKETGKPILICINMDGEIASEHYAGVRYRHAETTELYKPYVCVIASVYRHTPRDHDLDGRRVLCPRFGGVTCGEHIAIEPGIFEKFCDGRRIAPRHIMVELDAEGKPAKETYDRSTAFFSVMSLPTP